MREACSYHSCCAHITEAAWMAVMLHVGRLDEGVDAC